MSDHIATNSFYQKIVACRIVAFAAAEELCAVLRNPAGFIDEIFVAAAQKLKCKPLACQTHRLSLRIAQLPISLARAATFAADTRPATGLLRVLELDQPGLLATSFEPSLVV